MDDGYDDSYLRRQLHDLRRQLDKLRGRVDDLPEPWQLDERHRELSDSIDSARHQLDDRINELDEDLDDRIRTLRSDQEQIRITLERRLRWIERHTRVTAGAATTKLDPTPDLIEFAQRADRGKTLPAQFLDPYSRTIKDGAVKAWETWQTDHRTHTTAALNASRTIAGTTPEEPSRPTVENAYRAARVALADLATRRDSTRQAAAAATQQLARDDTLRRTHTADITEGEQAWSDLTTGLRSRLVDTIGRSELLPVWFDTVLGMTPPPDTDRWLHTGTELLAYRATYAINDPVIALGPTPDAEFSDRRREWYKKLTNLLRDYH